jgi:hypothetical protein
VEQVTGQIIVPAAKIRNPNFKPTTNCRKLICRASASLLEADDRHAASAALARQSFDQIGRNRDSRKNGKKLNFLRLTPCQLFRPRLKGTRSCIGKLLASRPLLFF